jgi:hypothetical protein
MPSLASDQIGPITARHRLECSKTPGYQNPLRLVAREDRDRRMKERGLVERTCIDRMLGIFTDDPTEYESSACCAMVTYSVTATNGLLYSPLGMSKCLIFYLRRISGDIDSRLSIRPRSEHARALGPSGKAAHVRPN